VKKESYFLYQEKKIRYFIDGTGPVVVLLHGFGATGSLWDQALQALAVHYTIIAPDLPGSGKSDAIDNMSMEGIAECIASLVEYLSPEPHCLIGHSMGGYISLAYAEQYPTKLKGLGLFHSTAYADGTAKKETRKKAIDFVRSHGVPAFMEVIIPGLFAPHTAQEQAQLIEKQLKESHNFLASSVVSYYDAMMKRPDRAGVLEHFEHPVLFVLGNFDTLLPTEDLLEQAARSKKSYIYRLERSGHMGMIEEPEKTNQILVSYLTRVFG
jgi:pimeloyl-ACP methyl ester carboxylesterase